MFYTSRISGTVFQYLMIFFLLARPSLFYVIYKIKNDRKTLKNNVKIVEDPLKRLPKLFNLIENIEKSTGITYNVGSNTENYTIASLAHEVKKEIPNINIKTIGEMQDERSYRIDFSKIKSELKFNNESTINNTIKEISDYIINNKIDVKSEKYYNTKYFIT